MALRESDIIRVDEPELSFLERVYLPSILKGLWLTLVHLFSRKRTMHYPEQRREHIDVASGGQRRSNYRGLHRLNKDEQGRVACVACFMCQTACPADCISIVAGAAPWPDREKYPVSFEIDELRCIYCGMCQQACPVDAIELTPIYNMICTSRHEMIYDKDKLLDVYEQTRDIKPRKKPLIVGYGCDYHRQASDYWQRIEQADSKDMT